MYDIKLFGNIVQTGPKRRKKKSLGGVGRRRGASFLFWHCYFGSKLVYLLNDSCTYVCTHVRGRHVMFLCTLEFVWVSTVQKPKPKFNALWMDVWYKFFGSMVEAKSAGAFFCESYSIAHALTSVKVCLFLQLWEHQSDPCSTTSFRKHFYREHRGLEVCKLLLFLFLFLLFLLFWRHFTKRL